MDYRKIYSDKTGLPVPDSFEIHHIDFDRDNNDIQNLVALPSQLHRQYHNNTIPLYQRFTVQLSGTLNGGNGHNSFLLESVSESVSVWNACSLWIDYRDYLLGIIPNIHNLKY